MVNTIDLGIVLPAPVEVHLAETPRPVQPDLIFVPKERQPARRVRFIEGAPALVIEVVSPTSIQRDRKVKYDLYERYGVAEYWIVDPRTQSVEVYTWSNGEYALFGQFVGGEIIESKLLVGLCIQTDLLFYTG